MSLPYPVPYFLLNENLSEEECKELMKQHEKVVDEWMKLRKQEFESVLYPIGRKHSIQFGPDHGTGYKGIVRATE